MKAISGRWRRPIFNEIVKCSRCYSSSDVSESEYKQKAVYPPILDVSDGAVKIRDRQALFDKYRDLHTVEEKLFAVNMPKYYGWNSLILKEGSYPYNYLPFVKHVTRTRHLKGDKDLLYRVLGKDKDQCKELLERIRPQVQEALLFELKGRRWQNESTSGAKLRDSDLQDIVGKNIVRQINNIIISALSSNHSYLLNSVVDYEPRVESFWAVGGFYPSEAEIQARIEKDKDLSEAEKNAQLEHWIQYLGSPTLQVRVGEPLKVLDTECLETAEIISQESISSDKPKETSSTLEALVEPFPFDPADAYSLPFERRFGTNLPGFWPGDESEFGLISYHLCGHLLDRPPQFGSGDTSDTVAAQAILSSYSWLHAQAAYQGFSTFHELTYPLVNQCIVTDGHHFSSHVYQLNTVLLHSDHTVTNPRTNVSLSLQHQPLYSDIHNNEFVGWNDEVLETLLLFYLNKPEERKGVNLKPYLNQQEKYLADISDEEKERREWLHKQFRYMYSNRPRHRLPYEIYDWERIYKIKFPMRPLEARLRPFELDCNPIEDRKYYQHMHEYIPKAQRTKRKHWTGWRAKFAKTYYPDIEN